MAVLEKFCEVEEDEEKEEWVVGRWEGEEAGEIPAREVESGW